MVERQGGIQGWGLWWEQEGGKVESNVDSFLVFIEELPGRVLDMSTQHTATRCNTCNTVHHTVSHKKIDSASGGFLRTLDFKDFGFVGVVSHMNELCHM